MANGNRSGTPIVVVVAVIGLLSTVGASALGGYWANRSVERQFESQRTAEVEDLRRGIYVDFVRATMQLCASLEEAEQGEGDEAKIEAKVESTIVEALSQVALVVIVAGPELRDVTTRLINAVLDDNACADFEGFIEGPYSEFVDAAQRELE